MPTPIELRQERGNLIQQAREIIDRAEAEKRAMNAEESQKWDTLMGAADDLKNRIERQERQASLETELRAIPPSITKPEVSNAPEGENRVVSYFATDEYRSAFQNYLATRHIGRELRSPEVRALQADSDTAGGYLQAPQQMVMELLKGIDNDVVIRGLARKFMLGRTQSLGVPTLDTDISDADWTTEIKTGTADSDMAFGKRELNPHPLAKPIKVSEDFLAGAVMDAEQIVRDRMQYKFGVTLEKACMTGTGAGQYLGVFTASDDGISTSRDVSTDNAATAITADGLINAKYSVKAGYWRNGVWVFHRDAMKQIRKLKDGNSQYIWQPGLQAGQPDTLLEQRFFMSEYAPNTFTSGLYVGVFGDFNYYWIADALDMTIKRVDELYAATNQIGFFGRMKTDGMPVLEEAFARVKLG